MFRNATVGDLLEEALASGQLDLEEGGTGKLRMVEIISNKILAICRPESSLDSVNSSGVSCSHYCYCRFHTTKTQKFFIIVRYRYRMLRTVLYK
jgi:hypothetical protein